jgi:hypothetical protein
MANDRASSQPPEAITSDLRRLKAAHFTADGREQRVARALEATNGPLPPFQLDPQVWQQIAEDPSLEEE